MSFNCTHEIKQFAEKYLYVGEKADSSGLKSPGMTIIKQLNGTNVGAAGKFSFMALHFATRMPAAARKSYFPITYGTAKAVPFRKIHKKMSFFGTCKVVPLQTSCTKSFSEVCEGTVLQNKNPKYFMQQNSRYFALTLIAGSILCLLFAIPAVATTLIPMSVEELTSGASLVTEGKATASWSEWNPQHSLIFTYTRFQVSRNLKGSASGAVIVKQLGGNAGGYTQHVSGMHYLRAGEESVLFLRPSEAGDGSMVVVGFTQGAFQIRRLATGEDRVSNGMPESMTKIKSSSPFTVEGEPQADFSTHTGLIDLENRVRKAKQQ